MKKLGYLVLVTILLITNFGCRKYLKEKSFVEIAKDDYFNDAKEARTVLLGIYADMTKGRGMYAYNLSILFPLGTDIAQVEGNSSERFRAVPTNTYNASQSEILESWTALYNAIYDANNFIETLKEKEKKFEGRDRQKATIYLAEARCLRALYYFELIRRWGHIALITTTAMSNQDPSTFVQADPVDVYKFMEDDLKYGIEHLPYANEDSVRDDNSFRFSKGGALGLLTKVYATWAGNPIKDESKWEEAAKTAATLIQSGEHGLLSDYEQLWKNSGAGTWNPKESLIEVSFYSPTATKSSDPVGRIGKWNGVNTEAIAGVRGRCAANVKAVFTFVKEWREHPQDLRRGISVANYKYAPDKQLWVKTASMSDQKAFETDTAKDKGHKRKQQYTPAKWDMEKYVPASNRFVNNDKSNVNWYILRYADVLLLYAESVNEWKGHPTADAYEAINRVRRRGYGLPIDQPSSIADLTPGMDQESFRKAVRKERGYELAFEGQRRLDLVRWGTYYNTVEETAHKLGLWWNLGGTPNYLVGAPGHTVEKKCRLRPIPQREMDKMDKFKQNFGW